MEWVILFILSWILFFIFIVWEKLRYNIWCGLTAIIMQLSVDTNAISHNFYAVNRPVLEVFGSSFFFVVGPVFVMGVLICQFHPMRRWLRLCNILVFTLFYSIQELLLLSTGALEYKQWHLIDSLVVNIAAMIVISWFATVALENRGTIWK